MDAVNVGRVLEFPGGLNHGELYKLYRYLSVSVAQREAKKSRAFVETIILISSRQTYLDLGPLFNAVRPGGFIIAHGALQHTHN